MSIDLSQPTIVAAAVGGSVALVVAIISAIVNRWTVLSVHTEKLGFDKDQAERRTTAEIELADRRASHDRDLAERRFRYDRELGVWKRRSELAEEVLTLFYEAQQAIVVARSPMGWIGEGKTRERQDWEQPADSDRLDSYYRTIERLEEKNDVFSQLSARRFRFQAAFGAAAAKPFEVLLQIRWSIVVTVRMLVETYPNRNEGSLPEDRKEWEKIIGWRPIGPDETAEKLDAVMADIESICRAVSEPPDETL